jgi:hypothetical protein
MNPDALARHELRSQLLRSDRRVENPEQDAEHRGDTPTSETTARYRAIPLAVCRGDTETSDQCHRVPR